MVPSFTRSPAEITAGDPANGIAGLSGAARRPAVCPETVLVGMYDEVRTMKLSEHGVAVDDGRRRGRTPLIEAGTDLRLDRPDGKDL
jgi:hypothetical protein